MRRLMLLRHAKSDWAGDRPDHERPLNARGREAAPLIGRYLASHALRPDLVLVSTARRANETYALLAPYLGEASVVHEPRLYEAGAERLLEIIAHTPAKVHCLLVIGHNPGLADFTEMMLANGEAEALNRLTEKFPTSGLAVLDFARDGWGDLHPASGRLDRFVTPRHLRSTTD